MNREMSVGSYLEFQAYAAAFFYPMNQVLSASALFSQLEKRLQDLHRERATGIALEGSAPEVSAPAAPAPALGKLRGSVTFRDVCFSYPGGSPLLDRFSLSLKPGERAALVGKSGSGKSTVVKLLQGLYRPGSGEVSIDGIAPDRISRELFTASIGCANQKINFFTASIRDNITLWDDTVSDAAVYRAVQEVGLHSFVATLEGGYDYILEENGSILSGGQQQRMELARALVYNPSLLVLDEVNGAIDSNLRCKEVELVENWWQKDSGAMLAFTGEGKPLALFPHPLSGYTVYDPESNRTARFSPRSGLSFKPLALAVFRPFPPKPLKAADIIGFMVRENIGKEVVVITLASLFAALMAVIPPVISSQIFDVIIPHALRDMVVEVVLALLCFDIATIGFTVVTNVSISRVLTKIGLSLEGGIWDRLLGLKIRQNTSGENCSFFCINSPSFSSLYMRSPLRYEARERRKQVKPFIMTGQNQPMKSWRA
jgi:ABC-type bacteriocin/lantibiotic exporter with double-glycine peptidase domain